MITLSLFVVIIGCVVIKLNFHDPGTYLGQSDISFAPPHHVTIFLMMLTEGSETKWFRSCRQPILSDQIRLVSINLHDLSYRDIHKR